MSQSISHNFYETGDKDTPNSILDPNGEVVLGMCRNCGCAESSLTTSCPGKKVDSYTQELISRNQVDYIDSKWVYCGDSIEKMDAIITDLMTLYTKEINSEDSIKRARERSNNISDSYLGLLSFLKDTVSSLRKLYLVGHFNNQYEEDKLESIAWDFLGVFENEEKAIEACYDENCFVAPIKLNQMSPKEIQEFPESYFPKIDESE